MSNPKEKRDRQLRDKIEAAIKEAHSQGLEKIVVTLSKALRRLNRHRQG